MIGSLLILVVLAGAAGAGQMDASAGPPKYGWSPQVVDMPGHFEAMSDRSLAFDQTGAAYVAYGGDRLYLAKWNGAVWSSEVVDGRIGVGAGASLALDADGRPYISYLDPPNARVMVAHWTGSTWQREVVGQTSGGRTAIALDSAGRPHVAYRMNMGLPVPPLCTGMGYASSTGAEWQIETFSDCGTLPSLALDALDRPHISFYDENGLVKYASRPGTDWQIEVAGESSGGYASAIALDRLDRPHILYVTLDRNGQLIHAAPDDLGWQREALRNGNGGSNVALAIDQGGLVHVAHGSFYMTTTITMTVDSAAAMATAELPAQAAADVAQYTSIALDGDGRPAISFVDVGSKLKCARLTDAGWQTEVIASGGTAGSYNAVAIDGAGRPHVGYISSVSAGRLVKYAVRSGDAWLTEIITGAVDPDIYPSAMGMDLAVADDGAAHAVFLYGHLGGMFDLLYGRRVSDTWQLEQLYEDVMSVSMPALAVDSQGRPHFVYGPDHRLLYGIRGAGGWQIDELPVGTMASSPALALDDADTPHLVYVSYNWMTEESALRYSFWNGSEWVHSEIEELQPEGHSLALDAVGSPHVAYISAFDDGGTMRYNLKYAFFDGQTWTLEKVDDRPGQKGSVSLSLDASGEAQIVYELEEYGSLVQIAGRREGQWRVEPLSAARSGHLDSAIRGQVNVISLIDGAGGRLMLYQQIEVFPGLYLPRVIDGPG